MMMMVARIFLGRNCGMEFSSIYWLSEIHGKTEALLLSKYQILPADDDDNDDDVDGSDGERRTILHKAIRIY